MMDDLSNPKRLLLYRKVTRTISEHIRGQLRGYLATLSPLLRPRMVLGEYIQGGAKEVVRGADKSFKDLQALYESVVRGKPFHLAKELASPIEILSSTLEMIPMEYAYVARTERGETKTIQITSPMKWVLCYSGYAPSRLKELLSDRSPLFEKVHEFIIHCLVMHTMTTKQTGVTDILSALHFPITWATLPDFGTLPFTYISSSITTSRPPDDVLIESTEISGMDVFEELINIDDIRRLRDPIREQLVELVRSHGIDVDASAEAR